MSTAASMSDGYNASCASCASCAIFVASLMIFYGGRSAGADDHVGLPSFSPAVDMCDADLSREEV